LSAIARSPALQVECVRIALTNVAATALRAENAEQALTGGPLTDEAIAAKGMAICDPAEDLRRDREYEIEMAGPMVRRALAKAARRCR
jgi:aerobic carbon-monoxide dehydrogenase medium subunit